MLENFNPLSARLPSRILRINPTFFEQRKRARRGKRERGQASLHKEPLVRAQKYVEDRRLRERLKGFFNPDSRAARLPSSSNPLAPLAPGKDTCCRMQKQLLSGSLKSTDAPLPTHFYFFVPLNRIERISHQPSTRHYNLPLAPR
jgi:hypothetical protein